VPARRGGKRRLRGIDGGELIYACSEIGELVLRGTDRRALLSILSRKVLRGAVLVDCVATKREADNSNGSIGDYSFGCDGCL
jgi:hypothetical protein